MKNNDTYSERIFIGDGHPAVIPIDGESAQWHHNDFLKHGGKSSLVTDVLPLREAGMKWWQVRRQAAKVSV